jgi:hypothetical protein
MTSATLRSWRGKLALFVLVRAGPVPCTSCWRTPRGRFAPSSLKERDLSVRQAAMIGLALQRMGNRGLENGASI